MGGDPAVKGLVNHVDPSFHLYRAWEIVGTIVFEDGTRYALKPKNKDRKNAVLSHEAKD